MTDISDTLMCRFGEQGLCRRLKLPIHSQDTHHLARFRRQRDALFDPPIETAPLYRAGWDCAALCSARGINVCVCGAVVVVFWCVMVHLSGFKRVTISSTGHEMNLATNRWEWDESASDSRLCFACVVPSLTRDPASLHHVWSRVSCC